MIERLIKEGNWEVVRHFDNVLALNHFKDDSLLKKATIQIQLIEIEQIVVKRVILDDIEQWSDPFIARKQYELLTIESSFPRRRLGATRNLRTIKERPIGECAPGKVLSITYLKFDKKEGDFIAMSMADYYQSKQTT